jgi:glutaminyl-peptide cyclotransferase
MKQIDAQNNNPYEVATYTYEVVNSWPHDTGAFTQGLVFYDDALLESTGHYGQSKLRRIEIKTGKVTQSVDIAPDYFAEGITIFNGKIYQLTWTTHKGFIYDLKTFKRRGEFAIEGEGWGLTNDDHLLIQSDGSSTLRFLDPDTFKTVKTVNVLDNGVPVTELNELEYIKGEIYANIWKSDRIARIDPATGHVLAWIDLSGLLTPDERTRPGEDVLNGIAWDDKDGRLFVTGKRWPRLFEIKLKKRVSQ